MVVSIPLHIQQTLKRLGFSANEIKILLFLIQEKQSIADEISKRTIISLSTVEYLLKSLVARGLIANTGNGNNDKENYKACSEEDFIAWIEKQKRKNNSLYEEAKEEMQSFFAGLHEDSWKPDVTYYEGKEGVIEIYEDILKMNQKTYSWMDIAEIKKYLGNYYDEFTNKKVAKQMPSLALSPRTKKNIEHMKKRDNKKRLVKFSDTLKMNGEIRIYGNKVAVITFDGKKPVGFVFHGKIITNLFTAIFKERWNSININ